MYSYTLGQTHTNYRGTDLSDRLPDQWVSAVDSLGSTKFHLESVSDSQSGKKKDQNVFVFFSYFNKKHNTFWQFTLFITMNFYFPPTALQVSCHLLLLKQPILVKVQQTEDLLCAERKYWLVWLLLSLAGCCCLALHQTLKLSQLHHHTALLFWQEARDLWQEQEKDNSGEC